MSKLASVNCYFAKNGVKVSDHFADIYDAIEFARLNLLCRHKVKIVSVKETAVNSFILKLLIPDEMYDSFAFGKRLRGISAHLLKTKPEKYSSLRVGQRLLYFDAIPEEEGGVECMVEVKHSVDGLVEKLRTVNHITGIESIIEMCREAADYIEDAEMLRMDCVNRNKAFEEKLGR